MKTTSLVLLIVSLVLCLPTALGDEPGTVTAEQWGVILNLSGRQRMLTQKMSKETLLVAAGEDADENRASLGKTMALFETTLAGLRDGNAEMNLPPTANKRIIKQLDTVKALYDELQPIFRTTADGGTPSAEDLAVVAEKNLPLLKNMNKAVKMYERESRDTLKGDDALAVVINLSGKQRMLTQKMSKEFLLVFLGINTEENKLNVRETSSLFDRTLKGLLDGDADLELPGTKAPEIREQLGKVADLWSGFYPIVSKATDANVTLSQDDVHVVAQKNLPLLKNMNAAVKMYEKQAKSQPALAQGDDG